MTLLTMPSHEQRQAEPGLLVANRGEIAVRVLRAARRLGLRTVAVHTAEESEALHVRRADSAYALEGEGVAAYLDGAQIVALAERAGCSLVHPGYGFLSEDAGFAAECADRGLTFVGPPPEVLRLFGDKSRTRRLATQCGVPVLPATEGPTTLDQARGFLDDLGAGTAVMVKALAGGGGRGLRVVRDPEELDWAFERCRSEAMRSFGSGDVYVERLLPRAKHIEVQLLADSHGDISHLWERECTVQRRHQKLVETAPSPWLPQSTRDALLDASVVMASAAGYQGLGTFEFLVDVDAPERFYFIETNPRLQVEHTVTEEITGADLVGAQIQVARGHSLGDLGLTQHQVPSPRGYAIQARVNLEDVRSDGVVRGSTGVLQAFRPPLGEGVRVDTHGYQGLRIDGAFDSLLAKVVGHAPGGDFAAAAARTGEALARFEIVGPSTNVHLLRGVLEHPRFLAGDFTTAFLDEHRADLVGSAEQHGQTPTGGVQRVEAPVPGTVVAVPVSPGQKVTAAEPLVVLEAMKMEHVLTAGVTGVVEELLVGVGDTVEQGTVAAVLTPLEEQDAGPVAVDDVDLDRIRPDLQDVLRRHEVGRDEARPDAVARRRRTGHRTARENLGDLCDPGTFTEYGALALAAQRQRRSVQDLMANTPADGMVCGTGHVNGDLFGDDRSRCVVMSYDYTVLAGTQGQMNHKKTDRMLDLAERMRLPVVLFAEGGGGRPGDTDDQTRATGLDTPTFAAMGRLSGLVPTVGVTAGRCFAGNAALLGCCDVIIATADANLGMGGPAMIEGGGLGRFRPEDIGAMSVQARNGVVDVLVADEPEAVAVTKKYLGYFQGPVEDWTAPDQRRMRSIVPENRVRAYDMREVVETLADRDSVLELRADFGTGIITALARVEGRPVGVVANNPAHLGGAIDRDAADKMARFLQLCDAHGLPVVSLCDTPGFMVGPEAEETATVRHFSRLFVIGANLAVPMCLVVTRKGYGLGAQAMAGGSLGAPVASVAWPTGELGPMGLEGAVKLGYRRELEAVDDPAERQRLFDELLAEHYERGKAVNAAAVFELDDVIDPADTRRWLAASLPAAGPATGHPSGREHPRRFIDTW
jgi:acetyl/propionyl-CoA carboxylase alpha subunit/acetyl-CoA carboxylase carboxyltransferase component